MASVISRLNNIGLGKKLTMAFVFVAVFSGVVGVIGMIQLGTLNDRMSNIRDEQWFTANAAMEMRINVGFQLTAIHEYMLFEFEGKVEYDDASTEIGSLFQDLDSVLGISEAALMTKLHASYDAYSSVADGNSSFDGLFTTTDNYYQAINDAREEFREIDNNHDLVESIIVTIEDYTEEETGHWNLTVADQIMEFNIEVWEAMDAATESLSVNTTAELDAFKTDFIYIFNDPVNDEDIINERIPTIAQYIAGATDGSIDQANANKYFNEMKVLLVDGNSTHTALYSQIMDDSTGLFSLIETRILAENQMFGTMEGLDTTSDELLTDLEVLESIGDTGMDTVIAQTSADVLFGTTLMIGVTLASLFFAIVIAIFSTRMIATPVQTLAKFSDLLAENDLTIDTTMIDVERKDEVGQLGRSFTIAVENLKTILTSSQLSSEEVASSAEELAATSEEVNALSEEIAATIQQISRGASNQSELSTRAIQDVNNMAAVVEKSLSNIEGTLQVIEDIAGQTNILALNAAIEAARAGEYGRGFAVVADNVRRLAEETKTNSSDIGRLTEEVVTNIGGSVSSLQDTLQGFAAQSEEFSASSEEVAAATEEQTAAMHQMTTAAQDLTKLGEELAKEVSQFKISG